MYEKIKQPHVQNNHKDKQQNQDKIYFILLTIPLLLAMGISLSVFFSSLYKDVQQILDDYNEQLIEDQKEQIDVISRAELVKIQQTFQQIITQNQLIGKQHRRFEIDDLKSTQINVAYDDPFFNRYNLTDICVFRDQYNYGTSTEDIVQKNMYGDWFHRNYTEELDLDADQTDKMRSQAANSLIMLVLLKSQPDNQDILINISYSAWKQDGMMTTFPGVEQIFNEEDKNGDLASCDNKDGDILFQEDYQDEDNSCEYLRYFGKYEYEPRCRTWYLIGEVNEGSSISIPYYDQISGKPVVSTMYKVNDDLGDLYLINAMDLDLSNLKQRYWEDKEDESKIISFLVSEPSSDQTRYPYIHPYLDADKIKTLNQVIFENTNASLEDQENFQTETAFLDDMSLNQQNFCNPQNDTFEHSLNYKIGDDDYYMKLFLIQVCQYDPQIEKDYYSEEDLVGFSVGYLGMQIRIEDLQQDGRDLQYSVEKQFTVSIICNICLGIIICIIFIFWQWSCLKTNFDEPIKQLIKNLKNEDPTQIIESGNQQKSYELKLFQQLSEKLILSHSTVCQTLLINEKNIEKALNEYEQALQYYKKIKQEHGIGLCMNNISSIYLLKFYESKNPQDLQKSLQFQYNSIGNSQHLKKKLKKQQENQLFNQIYNNYGTNNNLQTNENLLKQGQRMDSQQNNRNQINLQNLNNSNNSSTTLYTKQKNENKIEILYACRSMQFAQTFQILANFIETQNTSIVSISVDFQTYSENTEYYMNAIDQFEIAAQAFEKLFKQYQPSVFLEILQKHNQNESNIHNNNNNNNDDDSHLNNNSNNNNNNNNSISINNIINGQNQQEYNSRYIKEMAKMIKLQSYYIYCRLEQAICCLKIGIQTKVEKYLKQAQDLMDDKYYYNIQTQLKQINEQNQQKQIEEYYDFISHEINQQKVKLINASLKYLNKEYIEALSLYKETIQKCVDSYYEPKSTLFCLKQIYQILEEQGLLDQDLRNDLLNDIKQTETKIKTKGEIYWFLESFNSKKNTIKKE